MLYITQIIATCADKILLSSLKECLIILETVQKDLSDYLETKRMIFPRFFFLSDDELLKIIVQSKHVQAIQPYLKKCFGNMRELRFENPDLRITKMYSAKFEEVVLRPTIYPEGNVENWLGQVEYAMRNTLRREIIGDALEIIEMTERMGVHVARSDSSLRKSNTLDCPCRGKYHKRHSA